MTRKKWALLIVCILLLFGYFKLFYKTYTESGIPKSADCIIALDVKRVANTIIWNFVTTPGQWKAGHIFPSSGAEFSWLDMVKVPDYVFVFHAASQPANAWYMMLEIKNTKDFNKGLQWYHFENTGGLFYSKELGIELIQSGSKLLVGNLAVEDKQYIRSVAEELFASKQYVSHDLLRKNIDAASHLSVQIKKNTLLKDEYLITANFDKDKITFTTGFLPKFNANLSVNSFLYCDSSLCTLAFTQPSPEVISQLPVAARDGISKVLNVNIDSLLLPTNTFYQLDVEGIHQRVDSAISYTYDDNFNPVEKVVVNEVEEPAFHFSVQGVDVNPVYKYWKNNSKLEQTAAGELFIPMPFVKAYCVKKNEKELGITSNNYKAAPAKKSVDGILFFKLLLSRIPSSLMKYLPVALQKPFKNIESVEALVNDEKGVITFRASFIKKKNNLPLIEW